jgi:hypothetical protein
LEDYEEIIRRDHSVIASATNREPPTLLTAFEFDQFYSQRKFRPDQWEAQLNWQDWEPPTEIVEFLPRPPQGVRNPVLEFYIRYHEEKIFYVHYFLFHDHPLFFKNDLHAIARSFTPLSYAVAAFSALILSVKVKGAGHRETAFWYYSLALRELRELLEAAPSSLQSDFFGMVCTVLQLASFDV